MRSKKDLIPVEVIERRILLLRGQKIIVDTDLAELYGVSTKVLNQAVKRNQDRFSSEFMFRVTKKEKLEVVTNCDHLEKLKFSPNLPQVFTEYGVVMAANVLNSNRAIEISKIVVKTFIKLREMLVNHRTLAIKLSELESRLQDHDGHIQSLFEAIRQLMVPPESKSTRIGFITDREK